MKYLLAFLGILLLTACTSSIDVETEAPPVVEEPVEEPVADNDFDFDVEVGDELGIPDEDEEEERIVDDTPAQIAFTVGEVTSYGVFVNSKYQHEYVQLDITAEEFLDLSKIRISSSAKGLSYDGRFDAELDCKLRDLVLSRKSEKFGVEAIGKESMWKGDTVTLCFPTVITMTRNEVLSWTISYDGEDLYQYDWQFPANIQDLVLTGDMLGTVTQLKETS